MSLPALPIIDGDGSCCTQSADTRQAVDAGMTVDRSVYCVWLVSLLRESDSTGEGGAQA